MAGGQASTEFTVIIAISLMLIIVFLILATQSMADIGRQQDIVDAREAVNMLSDAANAVYAQGEGATRVVGIKLPQSTQFGGSTFIGKPASAPASAPSRSIGISIYGNDVVAQAKAPLAGAFPSIPGNYQMRVRSYGSHVSIQPALLSLDAESIFVSMAQGEVRQETFIAYLSQSAKSANVTVSCAWGHDASVNMLFYPGNFSAEHKGTNISLAFYAIPHAYGTFNSEMEIFASSSSIGNETFRLPISVTVQ